MGSEMCIRDSVEVIEAVKREALDSMGSLLNGIETTLGGF